MRAIRAVALAALLAAPRLIAQPIRAGAEYPISEPHIGRSSGGKFFGGAATDGEHFAVLWRRSISTFTTTTTTTFLSIDGNTKRLDGDLSGASAMVWSGEAYFVLALHQHVYDLTRIDRDGNAAGTEFAGSPPSRQWTGIASNGDGFLIFGGSADREEVDVRRYDRDGRILGDLEAIADFHVLAGTVSGRDYAIVIANKKGDLELLVIHDDGSRSRRAIGIGFTGSIAAIAGNGRNVFIVGRPDVFIVPLDPTLPIVSKGAFDFLTPNAAQWNGEAYELFYATRRGVAMTRFSESAAELGSVNEIAPNSDFPLAVLRTSTRQYLLWSARDQYRARIDPLPNPLAHPDDGMLITAAEVEQSQPAISSDGVSTIAAWAEATTPYDIVATVFTDPAAKHERIDVSIGAGQSGPATVSIAGTHFVIWRSAEGILLARIAGELLDHEPIVVASDDVPDTLSAPHAAAGAREILVAWSSANSIRAARVAFDGTPLDAEPIVIAEGGDAERSAVRVAWNGARFVVFWRERQTSTRRESLRWGTIRSRISYESTPVANPFRFAVTATITGLGAVFVESSLPPVVRGVRLDANGRPAAIESIMTRKFSDPVPNDVDAVPLNGGSLAVLTEVDVSNRITASLLDSLLHPYANAVVAIGDVGAARVAASSGHAFVIYTRTLGPGDIRKVFVRRVDVAP